MPSPSTRSLHDLATRRLRQLFPSSRLVRSLSQKVDAASASASTRCKERGCPYPSLKDGLCRSHIADLSMEYSAMRSTTAVAVSGLNHHVAL
jgi:hypothetical protein